MTHPLIEAIKGGHFTAPCLLLSKGANIHLRDDMHNGPLHYAAMVGSLPLCTILLSMGADVNDLGHLGNTALHYAYAYRHVSICKLLLKNGANVHVQSRGRAWLCRLPIDLDLRRLMIGCMADGRDGSAIWYDSN